MEPFLTELVDILAEKQRAVIARLRDENLRLAAELAELKARQPAPDPAADWEAVGPGP